MIDKESIFRELHRQNQLRDQYLDNVPGDLYIAVIDNQYVNSIATERDIMVKAVFGDDTESVEWFLYEWKPGYEVGFNGVTEKIDNIDQYIDWIKKYEGFK